MPKPSASSALPRHGCVLCGARVWCMRWSGWGRGGVWRTRDSRSGAGSARGVVRGEVGGEAGLLGQVPPVPLTRVVLATHALATEPPLISGC